jgi:hypothetical protein
MLMYYFMPFVPIFLPYLTLKIHEMIYPSTE